MWIENFGSKLLLFEAFASFLLYTTASSCLSYNLGTDIWCCKHIASETRRRMSRWIVDPSPSILSLQIAGTPRTPMSSTSSETSSGNQRASQCDAVQMSALLALDYIKQGNKLTSFYKAISMQHFPSFLLILPLGVPFDKFLVLSFFLTKVYAKPSFESELRKIVFKFS